MLWYHSWSIFSSFQSWFLIHLFVPRCPVHLRKNDVGLIGAPCILFSRPGHLHFIVCTAEISTFVSGTALAKAWAIRRRAKSIALAWSSSKRRRCSCTRMWLATLRTFMLLVVATRTSTESKLVRINQDFLRQHLKSHDIITFVLGPQTCGWLHLSSLQFLSHHVWIFTSFVCWGWTPRCLDIQIPERGHGGSASTANIRNGHALIQFKMCWKHFYITMPMTCHWTIGCLHVIFNAPHRITLYEKGICNRSWVDLFFLIQCEELLIQDVYKFILFLSIWGSRRNILTIFAPRCPWRSFTIWVQMSSKGQGLRLLSTTCRVWQQVLRFGFLVLIRFDSFWISFWNHLKASTFWGWAFEISLKLQPSEDGIGTSPFACRGAACSLGLSMCGGYSKRSKCCDLALCLRLWGDFVLALCLTWFLVTLFDETLCTTKSSKHVSL